MIEKPVVGGGVDAPEPGSAEVGEAWAELESEVSELCQELGITKATLYRYVAPDGSLRERGERILEKR